MEILDCVFVYELKEEDKLIWHGRYHSHEEDEYEVHFFERGDAIFLSNKVKYLISDKSLFLSRPLEFHSILPQRVKRPLTYYAVLFKIDKTLDNDLYKLLNKVFSKNLTLIPDVEVNKRDLDEIFKLYKSPKDSDKMASKFLFSTYLFKWLASIWDEGETHSPSLVNSSNRTHVLQAIDIMNKNIKSKMTIEDIAYSVNLSVEYFIRIFKKEMNITPYQYYTKLKIEDSIYEIVGTKKTISKISEDFNFENQFHFSRIFKKTTGYTPTQYRNLYSN